MKNQFSFYCAVASCIGVTAVFYHSAIFILLIILFLLYLSIHFSIKQTFTLCLILLFFFSHTFFYDKKNTSELTGMETKLAVEFETPPKVDGNRLKGLGILSSKEKVWISYTIQSEKEAQSIRETIFVGHTFMISGKLLEPSRATVENGFDFKRYLHFNKAHWMMNAKQIQQNTATRKNLLLLLRQLRERELKKIEAKYPKLAGAFTEALVFGDQGELPDKTYEKFKKLGIVHILALSGMQAGLVASFLFYCFIRWGMKRSSAYAAVACLLPLYAVLTGFTPSIVRACAMGSLFMFSQCFGLNLSAYTSITVVFLGFLLLDPYQVFQAGFQLTFLLAYGLLLSATIIRKASISKIYSLLVITGICQMVSLPITIYHFYEIPILGFISNLIYVPLFSFLLFPATFLVYLLTSIDFLSTAGLSALNVIFSALEWSTELLVRIPFSALNFGKPSILISILLCACIIRFFILWENMNRKRIFITFAVFLFILMVQYHHGYFSNKGEITFLDVGQGDSTCIILPHNMGTYIMDSGGAPNFGKESWAQPADEYDPGKDIIVPYLKSKGIRKIDKLILTHADQDHIGGAQALVQSFKIGEVLIPFKQRKSFLDTDIIKEAVKKNIPIKEVSSGFGWEMEEYSFTVVSPLREVEEKNDSSIVLKGRIGKLDWLITGDLGMEGEQELINQNSNLHADILKIGHHGSRHSSSGAFLDYVKPDIAIISAGKNNRYGHPHPEVIEYLRQRDISIFRTDKQGSIKYQFFHKKNGTLSTYLP